MVDQEFASLRGASDSREEIDRSRRTCRVRQSEAARIRVPQYSSEGASAFDRSAPSCRPRCRSARDPGRLARRGTRPTLIPSRCRVVRWSSCRAVIRRPRTAASCSSAARTSREANTTRGIAPAAFRLRSVLGSLHVPSRLGFGERARPACSHLPRRRARRPAARDSTARSGAPSRPLHSGRF